jgi:mono/diheme cytochrome c family protein
LRWTSLAVAALSLAILALSVGRVAASPTARQPDQVAAGAAVYDAWCASCHGTELEGGRGSALDAATLATNRSADRLVRFVRISMPQDDPGVLSEQEYYDVVAFLLDANGMNPDGTPLDASTAPDIALAD